MGPVTIDFSKLHMKIMYQGETNYDHTKALTIMSVQAVEIFTHNNSATIMGCLFTMNPSFSLEENYFQMLEFVMQYWMNLWKFCRQCTPMIIKFS